MAYNIGEVCAGPEIQDLLDNHFRICAPGSANYSDGTLMYLRSSPNMDTAMQEQLTRNNQNKTVEVVWMQRAQKSEVTASCTLNCAATEKEGTNSLFKVISD